MDPRLLKPLLLATIVLVAPVVLLVTHGESFLAQLAAWRADPPPPAALAAAVVAILASDVLLPVPSGPVSTLAGAQLGAALGTAASALGMTLGACIAFALARRWGRPLAERLSSPEGLAAADDACRRHGPWMLALTRPLPVVAEAAVLVLGTLQLSWRAFLPPMIAANVAISAAYAALGDYAARAGWLPLAVAASVALPLAAAAWRRRPRRSK
jgi:uncharacterized membrane protein YdjX (TVP38/TMEM64 family)